jgi:hypothetical protein
MISKSILSQILPTVITNMVPVHSLLLFLPEFQHFHPLVLLRIARSETVIGPTSTLRPHGAHTIGTLHGLVCSVGGHRSVPKEWFLIDHPKVVWLPIT